MKKKVCIIGAGASGLTALKHVLLSSRNSDGNDNDSLYQLEGELFEETGKICGIWNYCEPLNDDIEKLGRSRKGSSSSSTWTSPMYQGLRTNLPKEIMVFLDFPYENYPASSSGQSYIKHSEVLDYLNKYTDHFGLRDFIKFNRRVIHVSRTSNEDEVDNGNEKWIVHVQNTLNSQVSQYEYDSVIICNGHFNEPVQINEEISSNFKGNLYHCQFYRRPELHKGEIVVVIGAGPSGTDIAIELSKYAKMVYLSIKKSKSKVLNIDEIKNIQQISEITFAKENSVVSNGQEIFCNTIIYCTGYLYNYPFLKDDEDTIQVKERGKKVCPLFLQLIQPNYPSLAFIGLQFLVCPFLLFDCQSRFYIKYLEGKIKFTNQEMWKEIEESENERISNGLDGRKSHQLSMYQWPYFEKLAEYGGFTQELNAIMPKIRELYENAGYKRKNYPLTYRNEYFT